MMTYVEFLTIDALLVAIVIIYRSIKGYLGPESLHLLIPACPHAPRTARSSRFN